MPAYDIQIGQVVTRVGRLVVEADDAPAAEAAALELLAKNISPGMEDSHESDLEILSVELKTEQPDPCFIGLDLNKQPLKIGDVVIAYGRDFEEISRDESGGIPVVELDTSRPKPLLDVPLFRGVVAWNPEMLAYEVTIVELLVQWETCPATVRMGGGHYVYAIVSTAIPPDV